MRNDDEVNEPLEVALARDVAEVGKAPRIVVARVHSTVHHNVLASNRDEDAALADILPRSQRHDLDLHFPKANQTNTRKII